jgi:hypothetical protein
LALAWALLLALSPAVLRLRQLEPQLRGQELGLERELVLQPEPLWVLPRALELGAQLVRRLAASLEKN